MTVTPAWTNGSTASNITLSFDPFTQFATKSSVNSLTQDGTPPGGVTGFSIESDGTLVAALNNGSQVNVGVLALATFADPERLSRIGQTLFAATRSAGEPVIGRPDSGSLGVIESGSLELSTTDIGKDFVKLISYQRGFQGSSRMITAINGLLDDIINLAR
jgi:flagellar hook protein FlgE